MSAVRCVMGLLVCITTFTSHAREAVVRLAVVPPVSPPGAELDPANTSPVYERITALRQSDADLITVLGPGVPWPDAFSDWGILGRLPGPEIRVVPPTSQTAPPCLGVNVPQLNAPGDGWRLQWANGVHVAVVGVCSRSIGRTEMTPRGPLVHPVVDVEKRLAALIPVIRAAKPDVFILVADASATRVRSWIKRFPEFDAGIALAEQSVIRESRVGSAWLVSPGIQRGNLAEIRLVFDTVQGKVIRGGGHLASLPQTLNLARNVDFYSDPPVANRNPVAATLRDRLELEMTLAPSDTSSVPAFDPVWTAHLTRSGLRSLVLHLSANGTRDLPEMAGFSMEAGSSGWADAVLRHPDGKSLHATRRYPVGVPASLLAEAGPLPEGADWLDPRARWTDTGITTRSVLRAIGSR